MAKTRRNRSRRGGGGNEGSMKIGGKSRRRRGGQPLAPTSATTSASNFLGNIGSGATTALNKTKEGFSWALNKVFPGAVTPNPPVQPYALGGRRKRRGGEVVGFNENWKEYGSLGGSRRKRRGGQVADFDENWNKYGSVGGSRRRKKKC